MTDDLLLYYSITGTSGYFILSCLSANLLQITWPLLHYWDSVFQFGDLVTIHFILLLLYGRYGSTNVLRALSEAVSLRNPSYMYPVQDLDSLQSIDKYRDLEPGVLRDCICLKPHTTVEEAYRSLCCYPVHLLAGDYVRAEVSALFTVDGNH